LDKPGSDLLISILRYRDPRAAIDWLCAALGFEQNFVAEEAGEIVHAQLRRGDALLFLGPDRRDDPYGMHSPQAFDGTSSCVYIAIGADVDAHCERARAKGATIITEPSSTPYGSREYSCRDPEGHVWCIGTYRGEPFR
jgi:uncharacterized glyoxalase superfamily protein PhnB